MKYNAMSRCSPLYQCCTSLYNTAAPTENYDGTMRFRYLLFPTPDSSRNIELSCAIRPGQLEERYQVEWVALTPPSFVLLNTHFYDISINSTLSSHHRYQCKVTIEYQTPSNFERTYNGPEIIIEKKGKVVIQDCRPCIRYAEYLPSSLRTNVLYSCHSLQCWQL